MNVFKKTLVAFALAAAPLSIMAAVDASAACCVAYDYGDIQKREKNIIDTLSTQIDAMQLAIIEAMRLGTGQLSGNAKEQIATDSNIANVQDDRNVVGRAEQARLDAVFASQTPPSACTFITSVTSGGALSNGAKDYLARNVQDMLDINLGEPGSAAANGADAFIVERLKRHCDLYGSEADVQAGLCKAPAPKEMRGASLNIAKSVYYTEEGSSGMTLSDDRSAAGLAFIQNAFGGKPLGPMLPNEASTPGGRDKAARRQTIASLDSIAYDAANSIHAFRAPQDAPRLASWIESTGSKIAGYNNAAVGEGKASVADFLDVTARNWFFNADTLTKSASFNESVAMKELVMIESFRAYLDWEAFKQNEKQTMLLAGMLRMMTDQKASSLAN